jgi:hypothetical protein
MIHQHCAACDYTYEKVEYTDYQSDVVQGDEQFYKIEGLIVSEHDPSWQWKNRSEYTRVDAEVIGCPKCGTIKFQKVVDD